MKLYYREEILLKELETLFDILAQKDGGKDAFPDPKNGLQCLLCNYGREKSTDMDRIFRAIRKHRADIRKVKALGIWISILGICLILLSVASCLFGAGLTNIILCLLDFAAAIGIILFGCHIVRSRESLAGIRLCDNQASLAFQKLSSRLEVLRRDLVFREGISYPEFQELARQVEMRLAHACKGQEENGPFGRTASRERLASQSREHLDQFRHACALFGLPCGQEASSREDVQKAEKAESIKK